MHTNEVLTYANLIETARNLFPILRSTEQLKFSWGDDEGDSIHVSSDPEVAEAIRIMNNNAAKVCKFTVGSTTGSPPVHQGVSCDGCGLSPIVGDRFKCSVRENFDLCSKCEASQLQPHPMIKIYSPDQSPAAIYVALKENQPGAPQQSFRHHPPPGSGPPGCPPGPGCAWGRGWNRLRERGPHCSRFRNNDCDKGPMRFWRKGLAEAAQHSEQAAMMTAPFLAAADAFAEVLTGKHSEEQQQQQQESVEPSPSADQAAVGDGTEDLDQQLLDEAMRQSLQSLDEPTNCIPQAQATSLHSTATAAAASQRSDATPATVQSQVGHGLSGSYASAGSEKMKNEFSFGKYSQSFAAAPGPRPMARFVADVTLADGSTVAPGATVVKTWRVRNDGAAQWPDGVLLTFSSGDLLAASPSDLVCPVSSLRPGEETDLSVTLQVPDVTGRHVSYFRLRTKEGNIFGQRLWADLRVVNDSPLTAPVGLITPAASTTISSTPAPPTISNPAPPAAVAAAAAAATIASAPPVPQSHATTPDEWVQVSDVPPVLGGTAPTAPAIHEVPPATAAAAAAAAAVVTADPNGVWYRVWSRELRMLADMGFTDRALLLPLLNEHLRVPTSLAPEMNDQPSPEGMQRLLAELLSRSGVAGHS